MKTKTKINWNNLLKDVVKVAIGFIASELLGLDLTNIVW